MWDKVFLLFWYIDKGRPGGRMIPCINRTYIDGWGGGSGVSFPLGQTVGIRRRGRVKSTDMGDAQVSGGPCVGRGVFVILVHR